MDISQQLTKVGLSEKEAKIYVSCLELGQATILEISKKSKIKRTTIYETIETLKKRGLISEEPGRKKLYSAIEPEFLEMLIEQRLDSFAHILPYLQSLSQTTENKPSVRVYQGIEEMKQIYKIALQSNPKEICTFSFARSEHHKELLKYILEKHIPKRVKLGIPIRVLWNKADDISHENGYISSQLKRIKIVDGKQFPISVEVFIFNNMTAIISSKTYNPFGTLITSEAITSFFRGMFEYMWDTN